MASQVQEGSSYEWNSYVRGHHDYSRVWKPRIGEVLKLVVEPSNCHDRLAVAVMKGLNIVGHVPRHTCKTFFLKKKKDGSTGYCEVTGRRLNCGAGLGVEVPCLYRVYGRSAYVDRLKEILQ
jgi:hypothetical protein